MRKITSGKSLDPVMGRVYIVQEQNDTPDPTYLFKEAVTEENHDTFPRTSDPQGRVDFANKILTAAGKEELTAEEVAFLLSPSFDPVG